jgi:hypothetical protein
MRTLAYVAVWLIIFGKSVGHSADYSCQSPGGDIRVMVTVDDEVRWSASYKGTPVLQDCRLGLQINGSERPGRPPQVLGVKTADVQETVTVPVPTRSRELRNHAHQLTVSFESGCALQVRAYDNGVAYRFLLAMPGEIEVTDELLELRFTSDCATFFPKEDSLQSHYEVAWDWWNALNLHGVDFSAGINTQTYKYYIDFASQYGLEYIILDEGWSKTTTNLLETKPDVDVQHLVEYGASKNVGVILWTLWKPLDERMDQVLDLWASWGVRGIKVDFMQRADQQMVNFYERTARAAAQRKMLVDFHGAFKPAGLRRAYPNVVNYEGLRGLENCKWSDAITPEHDVTLPFVRMLAGPMDFTPGAMDNANKENFVDRFTRPMSQGTRCHQIAMYVIYDSPLQMLSDTPSNYLREPECTRFIARFPTTWHETRLLGGRPGEFIVMARRHQDKWYVAAMTNQQPREFPLPFEFLGEGSWQLDYAQDGVNAARVAIDHQLGRTEVTSDTQLTIQMAPGGGWAGILSR